MHQDYDFLIIGGGMVADAAANGIREQGAAGSIGILGEEPDTPFPRPALSKKLWVDPDFGFDDAALSTSQKTGATIHLDCKVTGIDPEARTVTTAQGDTFGYGSLLLATGGHPRQIEGLRPDDRVLYFRTLADYRRLRELSADEPEVVVVGGGYIGSEIAAALVQHGCRVTVIHPDDVLGGSMFPADLAGAFQSAFTDAGVTVEGGLRVDTGSRDGDRVTLSISDGSEVSADVVVLGLGIEPAGGLLEGLAERADDGGIVVDERLRTTAEGVYAAGDVANYPDAILGRRRVEHVDNADAMGAAVGRIMAGSDEVYDHTPMFYSDVFDLGFEAVGTLDASLTTVVDDLGEDGTVVYYLDDDAVRGVLLWNAGVDIGDAIALLAEGGPPSDPDSLKGRLTAS